MAESIVLTVYPRTVVGKSSRHLGAEGRIPGVLYGLGRDAVSIEIVRHDLEQFMAHHATGSTLVEMKIEGEKKPVNAMIRELQTNPIKGNVIHVDFLAVSLDALITATVSVRLTGDPVGVKAGGVLTTVRHELNVEAKPGDLPEFIEVDVTALEVGDAVHVSDIVVPEGLTLLDDADSVVAAVAAPAVEEEPEVEEGEEEAVEPELIGAKPEEE